MFFFWEPPCLASPAHAENAMDSILNPLAFVANSSISLQTTEQTPQPGVQELQSAQHADIAYHRDQWDTVQFQGRQKKLYTS